MAKLPKHRRLGQSAVQVILGCLAIFFSAAADAGEFAAFGVQPKISAGAGQTVSRGPTALFYNPANLIFAKFLEPDFDIGFAKVTYTYQHTDTETYAPAVQDSMRPLVTAGLGFRPLPSFALGVALCPLANDAATKVSGVAFEVTPGTYKAMEVARKDTTLIAAGGAAFRIVDALTLGAGVNYQSDKNAVLVQEDGADPYIDALYAGSSMQFLLGVRSELFERYLVFALSYKSAVTEKYRGNILINKDPSTSDYETYGGVGYKPAVIGFGAEARLGSFALFVDVTHAAWSSGKSIYKRGYGQDPGSVEFVDTNDFAGGLKFWPAPTHMLEIAFGMLSANVGNGSEITATSGGTTTVADEERVGGVEYGQLEAIGRMVFAGGYRYKITGNGYFAFGGHYETGSRTVPEGYSGEGTYQLKVLLATAGLAYGF